MSDTVTNDRVVSVSRVIQASPDVIFDVLADPARHSEIDGSGTVGTVRSHGSRPHDQRDDQPDDRPDRGRARRLELGSRFGMEMRWGPLPYRISNTVEEYEIDRLIAWAHFGGHRWRYRLTPITVDGATATEVTESFDWSTCNPVIGKIIERIGYPERHPANMTATLARLADVTER